MSARGSPYACGPQPPDRNHASEGANPLRRTSDRIESWFSRFLMLLLVLGLPLASIGAGLTAYESSLGGVKAQSGERQEVTARLTSNVRGSAADATHRAQVRWRDKSGTERTGTALVTSGTPEGATVRIWVDRDGTISSPPMTVQNAKATGWLVGGTTAVAVATGLLAARVGMRRMLDRRRYAQWDTEWDLVEPSWSARFRQ